MRLFIIYFLNVLTLTLFGEVTPSELLTEDNRHWVCDGYCFLGGDVPTNPFQPVGSTGATEEEARANIDCGMYQETGIVCKEVVAD